MSHEEEPSTGPIGEAVDEAFKQYDRAERIREVRARLKHVTNHEEGVTLLGELMKLRDDNADRKPR